MIGPARRALWLPLVLSLHFGGIGGEARLCGQELPDSAVAVRGTVVEHETGFPLMDAVVVLEPGPGGTPGIGVRTAGEGGEFLFEAVPPGLYRLTVSRMGFRDMVDTLRVEPGFDLTLTLPLSVEPVDLEPIVVVAWRGSFRGVAGFERRRRFLSGTFFDREEIEAQNPYVFTDLLRRVPGARLTPGSGVLFRGGCVPALVVDGVRVGSSAGIDTYLRPHHVEAVEVYSGAYLPAELGVNSCGAIVVWTRGGDREPRDASVWRQLVIAGGFILVALFMAR